MKQSILVVGGAGYIGSHMTLMLREQGYNVVVFDSLIRGFRDAILGADLVVGDLRNSSDISGCLTAYDIDLVMHFAALAYVHESVVHPAAYYDTNVRGTINLLDAMRAHGVHRIVFSSTCAVYGEPERLPIEEDHATRPVNPYGRTKLMMELAMQDYARAYGIDSISLRYFNAAGCDPRGRLGERHDPETHLIPLVLREALRIRAGGRPEDTTLRVHGDDFPTHDGTCIRDYVHVEDLCRAHLRAAERLFVHAGIGAEAYNLSGGRGYSVKEVIAAAERVTGVTIPYRVGPRREGDPFVLVGGFDKAAGVLGWHPEFVVLDDIIRTAWQWMQK